MILEIVSSLVEAGTTAPLGGRVLSLKLGLSQWPPPGPGPGSIHSHLGSLAEGRRKAGRRLYFELVKAMACVFPANQVIVVGGGLAGMSAANTVIELGGRSLLLDKSSFCGGNSTKATSGINGAGTKTQKGKSIPDNAET